jgi:class 3 adenylate cyclase
MASETPEKRFSYGDEKSSVLFWLWTIFFFSCGTCWYFTRDWMACLFVAAVSTAVFLLAWWNIRLKSQESIFVELQLFLLRCGILPENHKVIRKVSPRVMQLKKKEFTDAAYEQFQGNIKSLHESRYLLDKFVGTKASQFATQKGRQAVWEGTLTRAIVLISDVRGFTFLAEKLRPQETVRYLNRMFTELEEIISFSGGEINKFIGDSLLAYFPFPEESSEISTKKALIAALKMQDAFHQIDLTFKETYSETVHTGLGIGMAGGGVIMGNLGSARRMEFTLIGDTVNFASRLCNLAEDGQILVNQDLALIAADAFRMEALDPVEIKGKTGLHRPYTVMGEKLHPGLA